MFHAFKTLLIGATFQEVTINNFYKEIAEELSYDRDKSKRELVYLSIPFSWNPEESFIQAIFNDERI